MTMRDSAFQRTVLTGIVTQVLPLNEERIEGFNCMPIKRRITKVGQKKQDTPATPGTSVLPSKAGTSVPPSKPGKKTKT